MDRFVNLGLVSNPLNWVIVITMLGFGLLALHQVMPALNQLAATTARV